MRGMPDMQIYLRGGATLNIEFKAKSGCLSIEQRQWKDTLLELGHLFYVIKSTEDLRSALIENKVSHWTLDAYEKTVPPET